METTGGTLVYTPTYCRDPKLHDTPGMDNLEKAM